MVKINKTETVFFTYLGENLYMISNALSKHMKKLIVLVGILVVFIIAVIVKYPFI